MSRLYEKLASIADANPEKVAIVPHQITYDQLKREIDSAAKNLANDVGAGTSVEVKYESDLEFIVSYLALNKLGAAVVPSNPDMSQEVIDSHTDGFVRNGVYTAKESSSTSIGQAVILFSSGSTGKSKAIYLSENNLLSNCMAIANDMFQMENTRGLLSSAPHYILGLNMQINMMLLNGQSLALRDKSKPFVDAISGLSVSYISGVPMFYGKLIDEVGQHGVGPTSLRYAFIGGAPWSDKLVNEVERIFGIRPAPTYGLTEASPIVSFSLDAPTGSSGKFIPNIDYCLDEDGELMLKGPGIAIASGYEAPKINGGWFPTGDIVRVDDDGYIYIEGRVKELINKAGVKISPYEVEDLVRESENVLDCVACSIPSEKYGEDIGIAVIFNDSSVGTSLGHVDAKLRPRYVLQFDQFPILSISGKVNRKAVMGIVQEKYLKENS